MNRVILVKVLPQIKDRFPEGTIIIVKKALYSLAKARNHWFSTYYKHYIEKLKIENSVYDLCLLISTQQHFRLVRLQTDDTYILADNRFVKEEEIQLKLANLKAKPL